MTNKYGWPEIQRKHLPIPVYVCDTPNAHGYAFPALMDANPYISLCPVSMEPTRKAAEIQRVATAIHELVHIFQFETEPPRGWRWWNEATATAIEVEEDEKNVDRFRFLNDWIRWPEQSLDEGSGYQSFPFVFFLINHELFGPAIVRDSYLNRNTPYEEVVDVLTRIIEKQGLVLGGQDQTKHDLFFDYCKDSYFLLDPKSSLYNKKFSEVIGARTLSETFTEFPVVNAAINDKIDHLACRAYRFIPTEGKSQLTITIQPTTLLARKFFKAALMPYNNKEESVETIPLDLCAKGDLTATYDSFCLNKVNGAILVVANCAKGKGAPNDLGFKLQASIQ